MTRVISLKKMRLATYLWSPQAAGQLLDLACQAQGVEHNGAQLIRFGTNAVYKLQGTPYVARVARSEKAAEEIAREMDICRWLTDQGFPSIRPADEISPAPIEVYDSPISFWYWIEDAGHEVDIEDLAKVLKEFHSLSASYPKPLPSWMPMRTVARQLHSLRHDPYLDPDDLSMLWDWRDRLDETLLDVKSAIGIGPIHGDAHLGNCLKTPGGLMLIDFDLVCQGPREWDLIPPALGPRRFGASKETYFRFAESYGHDVTKWPYFKTVALARELQITTWRLEMEKGSPVRKEGLARLKYWRREDNPPNWNLF